MGQQRGSRVFVGVVLGVVAAIGLTQPVASADSAAPVANGTLQPDVEQYPTVCPMPTNAAAGTDSQLPCEPTERDRDGDGWFDYEDNCPSTYNPGQEDADGDGYGDACDPTPTGEPTTPPTTQPPTTQPSVTPTPTTSPTTPAPTTPAPTTPAPTTPAPTTPAPTVVPPGAPPGCQSSCAYVRQVELRVTATKLTGTVDSAAHGCRADATVTVWRKRNGADRRLVVLTSKQTGAFRTARPARAGRYYVTVASPEQPLCASATSPTVRVTRS